jgi:hypothetical protein
MIFYILNTITGQYILRKICFIDFGHRFCFLQFLSVSDLFELNQKKSGKKKDLTVCLGWPWCYKPRPSRWQASNRPEAAHEACVARGVRVTRAGGAARPAAARWQLGLADGYSFDGGRRPAPVALLRRGRRQRSAPARLGEGVTGGLGQLRKGADAVAASAQKVAQTDDEEGGAASSGRRMAAR